MKELTTEDKILGRTEPKPLTKYEKTALTKETKYTIRLNELDNTSIISGDMLANILDFDSKQSLKDGVKHIETKNGFIIDRIEEKVVEAKKTTKTKKK